MSALTDLFTALATKIRSKTGGSDTYTPPQMVNAIDDVYDAGVAAGETTHTQTYTPAANTAANDMGVTHDYRYVNTSGMIVPSGAKSITANGTGIDVSSYATANVNVPNPTLSGDATAADVKSGKTFYGSSYTKQTGTYVEPTINSITPSNTSPASMSANSNYKPSSSGYAIQSYTSISQSQLDAGVYFSSGMKKMASSGYAYSSQPTGNFERTTLWTNSNSTATTFSTTTVTLSSSMTNYNYLQFNYYVTSAASDNYESKIVIYPVNIVQNTAYATNKPLVALNGATSSSNIRTRNIEYVSNTQLKIHNTRLQSSSGTTSTYMIPINIVGLKFTP